MKSKNFKDIEIQYVDAEGVVYLKPGVKRRSYKYDEHTKDNTREHVNMDAIHYSKYLEFMRITEEEKDFD